MQNVFTSICSNEVGHVHYENTIFRSVDVAEYEDTSVIFLPRRNEERDHIKHNFREGKNIVAHVNYRHRDNCSHLPQKKRGDQMLVRSKIFSLTVVTRASQPIPKLRVR